MGDVANAIRPTTAKPAPYRPRPFQIGMPAFDAFPGEKWSRLVSEFSHRHAEMTFAQMDRCGTWELRRAIAFYLGSSRGVTCKPEQIFITAGYQGALGLLARALIKPDDKLLIEDPGYFRARDGMRAAGAHLIGVPVDDAGMRIADGFARAPDARFALTTPSHQAPLCVTQTAARRRALLDWADETGGWILEDDYDGEFHYDGMPLPALKSADAHDSVIFFGTFSKTLFPALRLGYAVVPDALRDTVDTAAAHLQPGPDPLIQLAVAKFMDDGDFTAHVDTMRILYRERRIALHAALQTVFADAIEIPQTSGGMHIVARWHGRGSDNELAARAFAAELAPYPLSKFAVTGEHAPTLLLGFTNTQLQHAERDALALRTALHDFL